MKEMIFDKNNFNLETFVDISKKYLLDKKVMPVLSTSSNIDFSINDLNLYIFDDLLSEICIKKSKYKKDISSILSYGYMGSSRGGKNGILKIPNRDKNLLENLGKFESKRYKGFRDKIFSNKLISHNEPIKIVTHRKNGERLIGMLYYPMKRCILYGKGQYKK